MAELLKPQVCVIGGGPAGLAVAAAAAALGRSVVLIEKAKMGGTNLNTGTMPAQALRAAARQAHAVGRAPAFGIAASKESVDLDKLREHLRSAIAAVAPNDAKQRFIGFGVRVIEGAAQFKNRKTVGVGDAFEIRAGHFVVATGSLPALPDIPGLAGVAYLTNETIFALDRMPTHLIVIGADAIGLALAQAFRRLGAEVTVLDAGAPLAGEDPECAQILLDQLERDGIRVRSGVRIARIEQTDTKVRVALGEGAGETIEGSALLLAGGRRPNVDDLGLDKARVRCSPRGIIVDGALRTRNRRVYAVGDVIGGPQSVHAARYQADILIRSLLLRQWVEVDTAAIPRLVPTDPELAHIGLTDAEALRKRRTIRVLRWPYHDNDRAQAEGDARGHIKVVTDRKGRILGVTIVGTAAGELIAPWLLAIERGLDISAIAGMMVPYPTLSAIGIGAARTYVKRGPRGTWVQRIKGLLRRSG